MEGLLHFCVDDLSCETVDLLQCSPTKHTAITARAALAHGALDALREI